MGDRRKAALDPVTVDAVLFDLDGTLIDTDDRIVEGLALRLRRLGWPWLYRNARRLVMLAETPVNGLVTALDALGLDAPLLGIWSWIQGLRAVQQPRYRLMNGARPMLADLSQRYQLAVVTTRGREDAEAFLMQYDLWDTFEVVVTRQDTWRLKPHPAPIRQAAERLGIPAERCAMVGDTTVDVKSARRAGAKAVAVTSGFGKEGELRQAQADVVIGRVSDLSSLL